jgi:hypothetical protein
MAIPQTIITEFTDIQAQINAAIPLTSASQATVTALQLNADQLVSDCEQAQGTLVGQLDTYVWTPGDDPAIITVAVQGLNQSATDEANIVLLRGLAGRMASNLNQLG